MFPSVLMAISKSCPVFAIEFLVIIQFNGGDMVIYGRHDRGCMVFELHGLCDLLSRSVKTCSVLTRREEQREPRTC